MNLNCNNFNINQTSYFQFKKLGDKYLLTNLTGQYVFLSPENFNDYLDGNIKDKRVYNELKEKNFVNDEVDFPEIVNRYKQKKHYLSSGPSLHIVITTLRCNQKCVYCHASAQDMKAKETDMNKDVAAKILDLIFQTPNHFLAIEFQGGEPLANWDIVEFLVKKAWEMNKKYKKDLELRLVTNLNQMNEEKYRFLIKNKVSLCTSLDGPQELHNKNRPNREGEDNYKNVTTWIKRFNNDYPKIRQEGYVSKMASIIVVSKYSLDYPREVVDEYINMGFESIFLRPLNPFGVSEKVWDQISYSSEDFLKFYKEVLDYIIDLNLSGKFFYERLSKVFLDKILTESDPNMLEIRSPCGAGIGQLAYNFNGDVYTCDEGRMLSMMGDENFKLGNIFKNDFESLVSNETVRTLCTASCLDALPGCSECVYMPYCGTCPIYNYVEQGSIFSQMPKNERCKINKGILDYLFEKLKDGKIKEKVFNNWVSK